VSRISLLLALSLWLAGPALAAPSLVAEPQSLEFGQVTEGILVRAVFVLTNAGDDPLRFPRQPSTSCGCTNAPLPRDELAPGESLELTVYFDSTGFGGQDVERQVMLCTNDPQREEFPLTIKGRVENALPFQDSASSLNYSFYLLVDLRSPEEYARGHLLGAVNIPLGELAGWLDRLPREAVISTCTMTPGRRVFRPLSCFRTGAIRRPGPSPEAWSAGGTRWGIRSSSGAGAWNPLPPPGSRTTGATPYSPST